MLPLSHYAPLAKLFDYPQSNFSSQFLEVKANLPSQYTTAHEHLSQFMAHASSMNLEELQETFTRSFDIQAATTLDVGYLLFGDDYKRGQLLVHLNQEHQKTKNSCGTELPDHLPNVLRLISKCEDHELIEELVSEIVAPALLKMISDFDPSRLDKRDELYEKVYHAIIYIEKERALLYREALKTLYEVLSQDFHTVGFFGPKKLSLPSQEFLSSIQQEIKIEDQPAGGETPCSL